MAKRLTDTGKYRKRFIRNLPGSYKLFWDFLYHECDHAGIWYVDFEIAQICLGKDMLVTQEEALRLFNSGEERVVVLNGGTKWLVKPFVDFQYGELNPINRVHQSVINILKKEGAYKTLTKPLQGAIAKDKDNAKDKDKDIVKDKDKKYLDHVYLTDNEHDKLIERFGEKITRSYIEKLNNYIGSKGRQYKSHYHTILVWADKDKGDLKSRPTQAQINTMASMSRLNERVKDEEGSIK